MLLFCTDKKVTKKALGTHHPLDCFHLACTAQKELLPLRSSRPLPFSLGIFRGALFALLRTSQAPAIGWLLSTELGEWVLWVVDDSEWYTCGPYHFAERSVYLSSK